MAVSVEILEDGFRLVLDGNLTINESAELQDLRGWLLAAIERYPGVEIDLDKVDELDSAGLQLLWAAKREAEARQRQFRMKATQTEHIARLRPFHLAS